MRARASARGPVGSRGGAGSSASQVVLTAATVYGAFAGVRRSGAGRGRAVAAGQAEIGVRGSGGGASALGDRRLEPALVLERAADELRRDLVRVVVMGAHAHDAARRS